MRIVFISTPTRLERPNPIPPAGILALAAYMEKLNHEVRVIDAAHLRPTHLEIARQVAEFQPDLLGISGIITSYSYIIGLTQVLRRELPTTPIVLGGPVVINNTKRCFEYMPIDFIIHGYGEIALAKLLEHLQGRRDIRTIPGLSYLAGGMIATNPGREFFKNLDEMPLPAYHHVDMEFYCTVAGTNYELKKYLKRTGKTCDNFREVSLCGALGCIGKCTFCIHEQEFVGVRFYSPEYIVRHMEFLRDNYNVNVFAIGEEMYIANVKCFKELNRLISERLPGVFWCTHGRAECYTPEIIEEVNKGNIFSVGYGAESFSTRVLTLMHKKCVRETNLEATELIKQTEVTTGVSFIVGNVGEDRRSIQDTLSGIKQLDGPMLTGAFYCTPYPGGRIWDWALERGIIPDPHQYLLRIFNQNAIAFSVNLTPFPDWIVQYWNARVNAALRLAQQKRKFFSSKRFNYYLVTRGVEEWAYFTVRAVVRALGFKWDNPQYDFTVDEDGALLPDRLRQGRPHLPPGSKLLDSMLSAGPEMEPFVDKRHLHQPPSWWRGSFVPLRVPPRRA